MNITRLDRKRIKDILKVCELSFDSNFHINEDSIYKKLFECEDFFEDTSAQALDDDGTLLGFIGVKVSKDFQNYPDTAWINLFAVLPKVRNKGIGTELLSYSTNKLKEIGIKRINIGQDYVNFFSGIPSPSETVINFFKNNGFFINDVDHYDLEADITSNDKIDSFNPKIFVNKYHTTTYNGEYKELMAFLSAEFPGRWEYEAKEAIAKGKKSEEIVLLWSNTSESIVGYCMLSKNNSSYGGLGPIGIAKSVRGNHVGDYILWCSLLQLRKLGIQTVNIDWTILKDFYGQFGFIPERIYRGAYKDI